MQVRGSIVVVTIECGDGVFSVGFLFIYTTTYIDSSE